MTWEPKNKLDDEDVEVSDDDDKDREDDKQGEAKKTDPANKLATRASLMRRAVGRRSSS